MEVVMVWQAMDTCPKDRKVLAYGEDYSGNMTYIQIKWFEGCKNSFWTWVGMFGYDMDGDEFTPKYWCDINPPE